MSASQHTIAHTHKSTSGIHPNGLYNPDHNPHQHHRYENITLDLVESDALCRIAAAKTKADFTRKKSPADIARIVDNSAQIVDNSEKVSTTALQPPAEKVSNGRDTL
ncbi:MAG: hypothetical protein OXH73_04995 [Caldilineaceae bacterium]|nr:hypothetical protein [Caldilineaceae bacterium]